MQVLAKTSRKIVNPMRFCASFKKFDYTDPLNFKSLLSEEEIMVNPTLCRSWIIRNFSRRPISCPGSSETSEKRSLKERYSN